MSSGGRQTRARAGGEPESEPEPNPGGREPQQQQIQATDLAAFGTTIANSIRDSMRSMQEANAASITESMQSILEANTASISGVLTSISGALTSINRAFEELTTQNQRLTGVMDAMRGNQGDDGDNRQPPFATNPGSVDRDAVLDYKKRIKERFTWMRLSHYTHRRRSCST